MHEESFDRYAASYGRPIYLPPPDLRDPDVDVLPLPFFELNQLIRIFAGRISDSGIRFNGYVGLLAEGVTNARSEYFEDLHIAVFGMQFCVELYAHFQCLLSHPGVFRGVGESDKEEVRVRWNNENEGSSLVHFGPLREGEMFGPLSKDPLRRAVATRLYHWAMRFVGFHEIGHLAIGHLHLLRELGGRPNIEDNAKAYQDRDFDRIRRALELQADLHALQRMALHAVILGKSSDMDTDRFSLTVFEMFTAITAVLRIWSRGVDAPVRGVVGSYPHPAVRFVGMVEAIRTKFDSLHFGAVDQRAWIAGIGISQIETSLQDVALGCQQTALDWMGAWDTLTDGYNAVVNDFRELHLKDRLTQHCVDTFYAAFDLLC